MPTSEGIRDLMLSSSSGTLPGRDAEQDPGDVAASKSEDGGPLHAWDLDQTLVLVASKRRLDDDKEMMKVLRNKNQRWQFVSELCAKEGVLRTATQCLNRWNRIWKEFKIVFDYEQHIPSGRHGYFALKANERLKRKLPRSMEFRLYEAMSSRFGADIAVNPGDVLVDTSADLLALHHNVAMPIEDGVRASESPGLHEEGEQSSEKEQTSGKKRVRPVRASVSGNVSGNELQDTNKKLLDLYGSVETDRTKWQKELLDIARDESEDNAQIARERLAIEKERLEIEKQTNRAFFEIASAIRALTSAIGKK